MKYSERSHPCLVCATAKNRCKPLRDGGGSCCDSCWTVGREILHETQLEFENRTTRIFSPEVLAQAEEAFEKSLRDEHERIAQAHLPDPKTATQVIDPAYAPPTRPTAEPKVKMPTGALCFHCGQSASECQAAMELSTLRCCFGCTHEEL